MPLPRIRVSEDRRFLVAEDGTPFFWLADTAWELFHRLTLAEAELYLETRRKQGFNVVMAVILAEHDGLHAPNAAGHTPLVGDDPARPNPYYFKHVDAVIRLAAQKGIYLGLLPTWGDKVDDREGGVGPVVFDRENARGYGEFLGRRYRDDTNLVWILGGDRAPEGFEAVWDSMAEGIIAGLSYKPLMSYHTRGGWSSSRSLHGRAWLDFNMMQSGHCLNDTPNWDMIQADYELDPPKPTMDGEPNYEHHPRDPYYRPWKPEYGRFDDYDVRKQAYRAVFAGACGHAYGSHSVWQMWSPKFAPTTFASPSWDEAIHAPGARQMAHLKALMLSRPYLSRVPAPELLPEIAPPPRPTGPDDRVDPLRAAYAVATRDRDGSYALVYFPSAGQSLLVDLGRLSGRARAQWYDPREGRYHLIGDYPREATRFSSPLGGPDWVLVLDAIP